MRYGSAGVIARAVVAIAAAWGLCAFPTVGVAAAGRTDLHGSVAVRDTVPPETTRATALGAVDPNTEVPIVVSLDFADRAGALAFAQAVNDPRSPEFRQFLTPEEIGDRFGPTPAEYDAVVSFLKSSGFTVTGTTKNRMAVKAAGTAAQVSAAFGTTLRWYREASADRLRRAGRLAQPRIFFSNDGPVNVPAEFAGKILSVAGLESYYQPTHSLRRTAALKKATSTGPFYPAVVRAAYDGGPLYSASTTPGSGRTIGISSFDGITTSDVTTWITDASLPYPSGGPASNVTYIGTPPTTEQGEAALDIEWSLGISPYADIRVYQGPQSGSGVVTVLTDEVNDNLVDVVSESYAWDITLSSTLQTLDNLHTDLAAEGITYFVASGDHGSSGVTSNEYPSVNPNVTVVGGTILTITTGTDKWYSEAGWNDSGGGYSVTDNTALPSWQVGRGVPTTTPHRLDPDIALIAAADNTGTTPAAYVVWEGELTGFDGTSLASPTTASSVALVEQYLIAKGYLPANSAGKQRLGAWNPTLYAFNGRNDVFHDITTGNNGYAAGPYWDFVTGWGSLDFYNLAVALEAPLAVNVTPQNPTINEGATEQLSATVAGSNVQTVTWSLVSGPGSVNATTGLYTAPATVTSTQTATVQAASSINYAAPGATTGSALTGQTVITIQPPTFTVGGTVSLQQCDNLAQQINFTFRPASGSSFTDTVTLGADGSFSIAGVPNGTYTIAIKGAKWLQADLTGVVVNGGAVSGLSASLLGGDLNNDNVVNIDDFSILAAAYGTTSSDSNWNTLADINCDGVVDINDFSILAGNFGDSGDP
jgi:subtilase family serine protease